MKKIYYLSTCSTCKRIINELGEKLSDFEFQDIKTDKVTNAQLLEMKEISNSFASLFSKKAMKFRSMGIGEKVLSENDYKKLILDEYTFLKRPVFIVNDKIFIGSSKVTIASLKQELNPTS